VNTLGGNARVALLGDSVRVTLLGDIALGNSGKRVIPSEGCCSGFAWNVAVATILGDLWSLGHCRDIRRDVKGGLGMTTGFWAADVAAKVPTAWSLLLVDVVLRFCAGGEFSSVCILEPGDSLAEGSEWRASRGGDIWKLGPTCPKDKDGYKPRVDILGDLIGWPMPGLPMSIDIVGRVNDRTLTYRTRALLACPNTHKIKMT